MFAEHHRGVIFIFLMAAMLFVAAGCSEETPHIPQPPIDPGLPFPASPDMVMQNFQTLYETRDFDEYEKILAPGFETILQTSTIQDYPDVGETLDVTEELRIHQRLFSGDPVTDPNGDLVPGVSHFSFPRFINTTSWAVSPPTDPIPNTQWALFDVEILFDRGQTFSPLRAIGSIKFYVTSRDSLHEGTMQQYHQMIGQVDLTGGGKAVERTPWGSAKAMFW